MRRIVTSLAVIGVLALGACSGGGTVLTLAGGNNTTERTIVTVMGGSNVARVLPGASIPISAVSVRADQNGFTGPQNFKWSAAVTTGQSYVANTLGQLKPCANLTVTAPGGSPFVILPDFTAFITIDPTNEANVLFTPPTSVPLPSGFPTGSVVTTNFPYCVAVSATPRGGSSANTGTIIVAVVSPTNPEQ